MKKITELCKLSSAILACALPLAVNAQMRDMARDTMAPLRVGSMAPDFTLKTLDDQSVRLADLTAKSKVVLVVLRGWPGYQCPLCSRQAHDFVTNNKKFKVAGAQVLIVYPGPADALTALAAQIRHAQ